MKEPIHRNDPCPCGSGKKYKKCHGYGPQAEAPPDSFVPVRTGPVPKLPPLRRSDDVPSEPD